MPSVSAQLTETSELLDSGETLKTETLVTLGGKRIVVTETLIAADGCTGNVTTTIEELEAGVDPLIPVEEYDDVTTFRAGVGTDVLVTTVTEEAIELVCNPPLNPEEVLGISQTPGLAVTGSNVNGPVAAGAVMIGLGGLFVAISKKSSDDES